VNVQPSTNDTQLDDAWAHQCTAQCVAGMRTAYESLFVQRCAFVESEAARRLGRRSDLIDDVAQETWLRVARGPRRCGSVTSLDAWLRRIVRSAAIDMLRSELARRCRERRVSRAEATEFVEDVELLETIRREGASALGMAPDERWIMELRARTGATVGQIAGWIGIGHAALDSKLRRAAERARAQRMTS
jgi:RNA polymerase sigma factor (sigma-70 family)